MSNQIENLSHSRILIQSSFLCCFLFNAVFLFAQNTNPPVAQARTIYKENKAKHAQTDWFLEMKKAQPNVAFAANSYNTYFAAHPTEFSKFRVIFEHWLKDAKSYANEAGMFERPAFQYEYESPLTNSVQLRALNPDWTALGVINLDNRCGGTNAELTGGFCDRVYINPYNTQNLFAGMSFGGLWVSKDQGGTWSLTDAEYPNGTNTYANQDYYYGEIEANKTNSNLVFAATEAGLLKSSNGGSNWSLSPQLNRSVSPNERPYYVATSPNNANIILSTFGKKIYRSTDGGSTWSVVFNNSGGGATHRFRSYFGTNTPFQIDERSYNFFGLEASLVNNGEYYLGVWNSSNQACIYKSTDNGATFSLLVNLNTTLSTAWDASTTLYLKTLPNNNHFFVYEGFVEKKPKYKFSPTGSLVSSTPINGIVEGFSMDWNNENIMYQGHYSVDVVTKSTNNGASFADPRNSGCNFLRFDIRDISAVGNLVLIGTDSGLTLSKDGVTTTIGTGFEINSMDMWGFSSSAKSDICLTGVDHNANFYRTKAGKWMIIKGADSQASTVHPFDDRWFYYHWGYGINRGYLDDSNVFTEYGVAPDVNMEKLAFHPNNLNEVYGVKNNTILVRSTDNLATANNHYNFTETINQIRMSRTDGKVMYCLLSNDKIKKTTDGGVTWTIVTPPASVTGTQSIINSIDVGKNSDEIWAAYGGNQNTCKVVYSADGGTTWTNITTANLPPYNVSSVDYQRGTNGGAYIGIITPAGVTIWYKNKTMSQWEKLGTNSIQMGYIINRLFPVPAKGVIRFGSSRGAYQHDLYEPSGLEVSMASSARAVDCGLSPVYFRDASAYPPGAVSFLWTFPGGSPATYTLENPSVFYTNTGKYNVTLKVTLADGQTQEKTWVDFIEKLSTDVCANIQGAGTALKTQNGPIALHTLPINSNTFSVSMWAKPEGLQKSFSQLISLSDPEFFGIGFSFSGYTANNNLVISTKAANTGYGITSPITLPSNEWSHIAVNYAPSKIQFFINGKMSWELTGTFPTINFANQPVSINGDPHHQGGDYKGSIDELLVYNRLLTQDEIREKMHLVRTPANEQGLVAYYKFDEYSTFGQALFSTFGSNASLPVAPATITTSTAPVGVGKSVLLSNLAANTTYPFPASKMSVRTGAIVAGNQIAATRLFNQPDQSPQVSGVAIAENYWIVHSWNSAGNTAADNQRLVLDSTIISSNSTAATVNLFRRPPNAWSNTWGSSILAAQNITKGATGAATFSSTTALKGDGQYIYAHAIELLNITIQPTNKTVCLGGSTTFTVVATGDSLKYQWQSSIDNGANWVNASEIGATTPTITVVSNSNALFRVVVSNNSAVTSSTVKLTVNAPIAAIAGNPLVYLCQLTTLTASGGATYKWSNGETTPMISVGAGTYTVTVTDAIGCFGTKTVTVAAANIHILPISYIKNTF
jgi:Concanavalin A-like lectin/glucanases superfamily/PKD domain